MIKKVAVLVLIGMLLGAVIVTSKDGNHGFYLIREEGTIQYKTTENTEFKELNQDEISLPNGSFIKLSAYSSAHIILPDNSLISLDQNTEIKVNIENKNVYISQISGNTWNRVETLTNGNSFEIEAGSTKAKAEGTIFGIGIKSDSVSSNIEDGQISLQTVDSKIILDEGESGLSSLGVVVKTETEIELKKSRWYIRNKVLDVIKRTGLDNIFLKDKLKKELAREDLIQTRFNPPTSEIKDSIFEVVTASEDPEVCSKSESIPEHATYSKYSKVYQQVLSDCEDKILTSDELDNLAKMYIGVK